VSSRARAGAVIAGKYKLIERLGGGGMGEVFRAEHQFAGRLVALKLLRRDFAEDPDLTRRFFQEAQAVNRIRHPNIVDVLDAGICEEGPYVVMECLEGASLSTVLARAGRLVVSAALAVVMPMLDALDAAHHAGIVHRDLKPENVFLARQGAEVRVKLVDFGIAKVQDSGGAPRTHTGVVFGTPDYLSPEQASGEGTVDGRSDLFAVGIVLFELLTGHRPFEAPSAVATAYKIVHAPAPQLATMGVKVDALVQNVLDIALSKDPEDRFANAASFADMVAPLVPDGATRRELLEQLVDAVVELQPTVAVPAMSDASDASDTSEPLPLIPEVQPMTRAATTGAASDVRVTSDGEALEASPPQPVAPTLASHEFPIATRYAKREEAAREESARHAPAIRERVLEGRAPVISPPATVLGPPSPAMTPRSLPLGRASSPTPIGSDRASHVTPARAATRGPGAHRAGWTPRPLPAHVRGKCHTRGSMPRAVSRWIERTFGETGYREVLGRMPPDIAESFRTDGFNALVWYDLDTLDMFLEASTALLLGGDVALWRELACTNFERDLGAIFRPSQRQNDPVALLKRSSSGWARIYDFGSIRVIEPTAPPPAQAPMRALIRIDGFEAASLALRNATMGTSEGMLRSVGLSDVTARVTTGETSFARDFEYEIAWGARG
jgi:serine/threonine protein kinase